MKPLLLLLALSGCSQVDRPAKKAEEKKVLTREHKADDPHYYDAKLAADDSAVDFKRLRQLLERQSAEIDKHYPEMKKYGGIVPWLGSLERRIRELEREKRDLRSELELMNKVDHVQNEIMNELVGRVQRLEKMQ